MTWGGVSIIWSAADAAKNAVRKFWTRSFLTSDHQQNMLTRKLYCRIFFLLMGQNFTKMNQLVLKLILNLLKWIRLRKWKACLWQLLKVLPLFGQYYDNHYHHQHRVDNDYCWTQDDEREDSRHTGGGKVISRSRDTVDQARWGWWWGCQWWRWW